MFLKIARETLGASQKNPKSCLLLTILLIHQDIGPHLLTKTEDLSLPSTTSGAGAGRNPLGPLRLLPRKEEPEFPLWVAGCASAAPHSVSNRQEAKEGGNTESYSHKWTPSAPGC